MFFFIEFTVSSTLAVTAAIAIWSWTRFQFGIREEFAKAKSFHSIELGEGRNKQINNKYNERAKMNADSRKDEEVDTESEKKAHVKMWIKLEKKNSSQVYSGSNWKERNVSFAIFSHIYDLFAEANSIFVFSRLPLFVYCIWQKFSNISVAHFFFFFIIFIISRYSMVYVRRVRVRFASAKIYCCHSYRLAAIWMCLSEGKVNE